MHEGGDGVNIDAGHARVIWGRTNEDPPGKGSNTPVTTGSNQETTTIRKLIALAQHARTGTPLNPDYLELFRLILRFAENPESVVPADERLLEEIIYRNTFNVCPVTGCWRRCKRRDDLIKHIRKPTGPPDATFFRRHHELDVKYQGMELICCGETHTNFGVLVKHMKTHRGTYTAWDPNQSATNSQQKGETHLMISHWINLESTV